MSNPSHNPEPSHLLSVVVPFYNEEKVLQAFYNRLRPVLDKITDMDTEILFVNDGSGDGSLQVITALRQTDPRIGLLDLSRNFGKEAAMTAGLDVASGGAVVIIDADLQDPPELIPKLIVEWRQGYDVVYAKRLDREGETFLKKWTARMFYGLMQHVGRVHIPADTGDFRLLSRRAVDSLKTLREQHRFMKGLFTWIGYPQKAVEYHRDPRAAGRSQFNYFRLWNFAVTGITSFTAIPLKIAAYLGLLIAGCSFAYGTGIVIKTLLFGEPVQGYPSLMVVILFLGGIQLMAIGVMGEYIGRLFDETKRRPLYFINQYFPSER